MHQYTRSTLNTFALALLFCLGLAAQAPVHAQDAAASPPAPAAAAAGAGITPAEARRAVDVLQDDTQRAHVLQTLKAIAGAAPAKEGEQAAVAADTPAPAAKPASPAAAPAAQPAAIVPLEANGLTARMMRGISAWADGMGMQVKEFGHVVATIPPMFVKSGEGLRNPQAQHLIGHLLLVLLAVFVIGMSLEWMLQRLLRRPRAALIDHAELLDAQALERELARRRHSTAPAHPTPIARAAAASAAAAAAQADTGAAAEAAEAEAQAQAAGVRPVAEGMAMVQTTRNGVETVEAVPVGKDNAAGPASTPEKEIAEEHAAAAPPPSRDEDPDRQLRRSSNHWRTLRHIPHALGTLLIDLLPLALFFFAAALTLKWVDMGDGRIHFAATGFINAYVMTRLTMTVVRWLVSPVGHGLRILHVSPEVSTILQVWIRRVVALALFGIALADTGPALGTVTPLREAFIKTASLLVHTCMAILILRLRRPVAEALRARGDAYGPLAVARSWVADVWAYLAVVLVMGLWVVWALGVEDGLPKLIHFVVVSGLVIVAARVLAIFLLGAVGRLFQRHKHTDDAATPADNRAAMHDKLTGRYFGLVRNILSLLIWISALIALLQVWGLDALSWFATGTLGASLASAVLTILVSIIIAIAVWEASQYAVELRLARWMRQGEVVRAARLRTLLPMLRTALFVIVVLVVGMTVLSQLGVNTTPMVASASIIGVALGFGSQKLVQDFITGIFLLMENAMRVGDWVTVAGVSGSVEYLSIRTVRLRGGDGSLYIVPFSSVSTVNNTNRGLGNAAVRISVSYDTDVDRAIKELKNIGAGLREDPAFRDVILNDIEVWGVDSVDGSMVTLAGQMRCSDKGRWGVQREINRRILERFRELGIEIANPRASLLVSPDASAVPPHAAAPEDADGEAARPPRRL